ncbi:MAG: thiamine phosphate synthase [Deltaproteobacteria bacterium]|nr:thiamine phosphate synthase [Deltaproteobacteria bacterium]
MSQPLSQSRPVLCLVTNREVSHLPLPEAVAQAIAGGVDWIQIRERAESDAELLKLSQHISDVARNTGPVKIWVNGRLDIALAIDADGLHLSSTGIPAEQAASFLASIAEQAPRLALSLATHSENEIREAQHWGVDCVQLAPVFAPLSKPTSRAPLGLNTMAQATTHRVPVLAQGGVTPERCAQLIRAGCAGVAVTGAILQSSQPIQAARAFRNALDKA